MLTENVTKSLPELCNDILVVASEFKHASNLGDPETLRRRMARYFSELDRQARETNIDSEDVRDARFALAALLDEMIIASGLQSWQANPLAVEYFNTWVAGDEFFKKIEELRSRAHTKAGVLEVYYLCLALGFKGRYSLVSPERLKILMDEIYQDLTYHKERETETLSPHWQRSDEFFQKVSTIPLWAIIGCGIGIAVLIMLVFRAFLGGSVNEVVTSLKEFLGKS